MSGLVEVSFANTRWSVTLPEASSLEDIELPDFWKHVAKKLKVGDTIEVRSVDHAVFAEAYVRGTDPVAIIKIMWASKLVDEVEVEGNFRIQFVPAKKSHCVYLDTKNERDERTGTQLLREGFQTKEAAAAWIMEHKKQVLAGDRKAA